MIKSTKKSKRSKWENAQTMVEFAIVFPIVLLITYGLIEFGRMVFIYSAVTGSAREGARYGATASNYKNCDGIRTATDRLAFLISDGDISINIWYDAGPNSSTPKVDPPINPPAIAKCSPGYTFIGPGMGPDLTLGDRIVVHMVVSYHPLIGSFLGVTGFNIPSTNYRTILMNIQMPTPTHSTP
jgi:hypothetical protein